MYAERETVEVGDSMAKSNAERQRAYRERHLNSLDGEGERLNTIISLVSKRALERLAACYGVTQREALERAIDEAQNRLLSGLSSEQQTAYYEKELHYSELGVTQ